MEDNKFWLRLWQTVILGAVLAFAVGVTSCQMTREKIVRGIEAGADPIALGCVLDVDSKVDRITCHELGLK